MFLDSWDENPPTLAFTHNKTTKKNWTNSIGHCTFRGEYKVIIIRPLHLRDGGADDDGDDNMATGISCWRCAGHSWASPSWDAGTACWAPGSSCRRGSPLVHSRKSPLRPRRSSLRTHFRCSCCWYWRYQQWLPRPLVRNLRPVRRPPTLTHRRRSNWTKGRPRTGSTLRFLIPPPIMMNLNKIVINTGPEKEKDSVSYLLLFSKLGQMACWVRYQCVVQRER